MMKVNHQSEEVCEKMKDQDVFEIEKGMYDDIVPEFEKLYADAGVEVKFSAKSYNLPIKQDYILLENLCQRGFKNANRLEGLDKEHTENVLKKLAQWHAASAHRVTVKGPYEQKYIDGYFKSEGQELMKEMFDGMGKIFVSCAEKYSNFNEYGKDLVSIKSNIATRETLFYSFVFVFCTEIGQLYHDRNVFQIKNTKP